MKVYLDSNVLIAASVRDHQHHGPAFDLVETVNRGKWKGVVSSHALAEFYAVLTRAPFVPRIHPHEAGRFLDDNILPRFEIVALSTDDYKAVLRACINEGLSGSVIYDALHLHCARKSGCERLYTFNVKDFRMLAAPEWRDRICAP